MKRIAMLTLLGMFAAGSAVAGDGACASKKGHDMSADAKQSPANPEGWTGAKALPEGHPSVDMEALESVPAERVARAADGASI